MVPACRVRQRCQDPNLYSFLTPFLYSDSALSLSTDGDGSVFVAGTADSLGGPYAANPDVFVRKLTNAGQIDWIWQVGTQSDDMALGLSFDGHGAVYVGGFSGGNLTNVDPAAMAFVARLVDVPEPNIHVLLGIGGIAFFFSQRRRAPLLTC